MPELPKNKVGIVACSGEELAEGTVTRLAALQVLEKMRPSDTVTICLPLFLAGGEGDRAFAKFYPTIAVDGCALKCAARATEMYSSKPAGSIVVTDVISNHGLGKTEGRRHLNAAGLKAVEVTAAEICAMVDELLGKKWDRRVGNFLETQESSMDNKPREDGTDLCACGSGIPVQKVQVDGKEVSLVGLPLIFAQFREAGKTPNEASAVELLEMVRVYNPLPDGMDVKYRAALLHAYESYCQKESVR
jgi:uncharacterized metal-binding protein